MFFPTLILLDQSFTIHQLPANAGIPGEVVHSPYYWLAGTTDELSIVCEESIEITESKKNIAWSALKVKGLLDLSMTGIISGISSTLAAASISIFALSTYQTDYFLVKTHQLSEAIITLKQAGYTFE